MTSQHSYPTIKLPSDLCNSAAREQAKTLLKEELPDRYPDYEVYYTAGWGIVIQRNDMLAEMERRETALLEEQERQKQEKQEKQAETAAHIAEIEALLQEAIRNGDTSCTISGTYTGTEVNTAVANMGPSDYSFDEYTSADYQLRQYGRDITIYYNQPAE